MANLIYDPMNPLEIPEFVYLTDLVSKLKNTLVTLVSVRQYVAEGSGRVSHKIVSVGGKYENAKMKDLVKVLSMAKECQFEGKYWIEGKTKTDWSKLVAIATKSDEFSVDFSEFKTGRTANFTDEMFFTAWQNTIRSLVAPNQRMSDAQKNKYRKICTGIYQNVDDENRYYIKGYSINDKEIAPAIITSNKRDMTLAQNAIKYGLNFMTSKMVNLHLKMDNTRIRLNGTEVSIMQTAEKIREVRAINTEKQEAKNARAKIAQEKRDAKEAKAKAKK